jgi:hypothetical protein
MSTLLDIKKLTAVPSSFAPNTLYFIGPSDATDELQIILSSKDGSTARHAITKSEIQDLINSAIKAANAILYAADITARNALSLSSNAMVYVADATGDSTVKSGAALYFYDSSKQTFTKVAEYESMDLVITWDIIQGKPTSAVADIDAAVTKAHTHANEAQLDKIGEDSDGNLTYNGKTVGATTSNNDW